MKTFHCGHCQHLVFFENVQCVTCGSTLAYLPDENEMLALEAAGPEAWRSRAAGAGKQTYRLCQNYCQERVCNWALPAKSPAAFCTSCQLTVTIPDLSTEGNREKWYRMEAAKRRLLYTLMHLELPLVSKTDDPAGGLQFEFLADEGATGGSPVLTGHANGRIVVNLAEADDAEREKRRLAMHEPYRTLLGHFRHEIGHYYWDRLIKDGPWLAEFRAEFGDESADYAQALDRHYQAGPPADWQEHFVSAYASSHPWEDWAETWAHYLHMSDVLETAASAGLWLRPPRSDEPALTPVAARRDGRLKFPAMIENWFPLTYVLNNLNRGMGLIDAYPFVLSPAVVQKLRFIHEKIEAMA